MRFRLLQLLALAIPTVSWASDDPTDDIRIAMRVDTPPFVSIDAGSGAYVGFFYDVCTEAVTRVGYQFTEHPITAAERNAYLTTGEGEYDLLCDPTTITLSRMSNFANRDHSGKLASAAVAKGVTSDAAALDFSQIVFVANGGYASRTTGQDPDWAYRLDTLVENDKKLTLGPNTQACSDLFHSAEALKAKPEPNGPAKAEEWHLSDYIRFRYKRSVAPPIQTTTTQLFGYVVGSTIRETVLNFDEPGVRPVACSLPSHEAAVAAFCAGKLDRYYGDLDIVRASVATFKPEENAECEANYDSQGEFTYEPYAFVVSSRLADFPERFKCAIFSMFADGTMESLYAGRFEAQKSAPLATLFSINRIPAGRRNGADPEPRVCGIDR